MIYELTWSRQLVHILGTSLFTITTVVSMVMGGLAAGSLWASSVRFADGRAIFTYGLLQLLSGISALFCLALFAQSFWQYLPPPLAYLLVGAAVFCPNFFMGATWPVLARHFSAYGKQSAAKYLYAFNLLGATIGTICGGFLLLPNLGLTTSSLIAAAINFTIFITASAFHLNRKPTTAVSSNAPASSTQPLPYSNLNALLLISFGCGLTIMILEIAWTRFFGLVLGCSTYALSLVLACFIGGQFLGALSAARFSHYWLSPPRWLALTCFFSAVSIYAGLCYYNHLPQVLLALQAQFLQHTNWSSFDVALAARATVCILIMLLPAILLGGLFPLTLACSQSDSNSLGKLYAASSLGAVAGTWLGGFCLLPALSRLLPSGIQSTLLLAACILLGLSGLIVLCLPGKNHRPAGSGLNSKLYGWCLGCILLTFLTLNYPPAWNKLLLTSGLSLMAPSSNQKQPSPSKLLFYREGLSNTVTVEAVNQYNLVVLKNDGKVEASVPKDIHQPSANSSLSTQVLLGQLPLLFHPGPVHQALVIGYGSGTTCGSMLTCDTLQKLKVAELEPGVLAADGYFQPANNNPLSAKNSSRLTTVLADGRHHLYTHPQNFDVIVCQPSDPWLNGASDVFTLEFWQLGRQRLNRQGVFCQWLQLYAITPEYLQLLCRTFAQVFPQTLVVHPPGAGEILLLGKTEPWQLQEKQLLQRFYQPAVRRDLLRIGVRNIAELRQMIIQGPKQFQAFTARSGDTRLNTDDNLLTEFALPRSLWQGTNNNQNNLQLLSAHPANLQDIYQTSSWEPEPIRQSKWQLKQASAYAEAKQWQKALNELDSAASADPLNPEILSAKADIYQQLQLRQQAENSLRRALSLDPGDFSLRLKLGKLLCRNHGGIAGLEEIKAASRIEPKNPDPYLYVTCWFISHENWPLARKNLQLYRLAAPGDKQGELLADIIQRQSVSAAGKLLLVKVLNQ